MNQFGNDDDNDDDNNDEKAVPRPTHPLPPPSIILDHDGMLKARATNTMFRLPEGAFRKKRSIAETDDPYKTLTKRREQEADFKLPQTEFTRRQRYKDSDGNKFAPAIESDELYRSLLTHNIVDELDPSDATASKNRVSNARGLPRKSGRNAVDEQGTVGTHYGRALFFVSLKRDGKLHKWPKGEVEFVDPTSDTVFSATVVRSIFKNRSKGGYVVLKDVVSWGRLSNPRDFFASKPEN